VILELLRPEGDWLRSISAALRFAYYGSCLCECVRSNQEPQMKAEIGRPAYDLAR
jgi:hypothetical protein